MAKGLIPYENQNLPLELVPFPFPNEMVNSDKRRFMSNISCIKPSLNCTIEILSLVK